ncbi:hypothetical protein TPMD03_41 [Thiohalocapsa phage LS06-2018-MD03]|nr:hypothetical protein TPMD03_41 [Thiohalocapsa phage LS06-2018-MD03]
MNCYINCAKEFTLICMGVILSISSIIGAFIWIING